MVHPSLLLVELVAGCRHSYGKMKTPTNEVYLALSNVNVAVRNTVLP